MKRRCFRSSSSPACRPLASAQPVTFSKDVAPILQKACQNCHRPGAIAPMSLLTYQDARPWARSIKQKVVVARDAAVVHRPPRRHQQVQGRSVADATRRSATITTWVDQGAPAGQRRRHAGGARVQRRRQVAHRQAGHGRDAAEAVRAARQRPRRVLRRRLDPGFKEDMYIAAVETKPEPYSFKVVHHATANMIEDEEADPVGFFFNEYALGKNGDIFPGRIRPPDQGRLEDPLQPAPASERRAIAGQPVDRVQAVPERAGAEARRVHAAHGRQRGSRHPAGTGGAHRRLLPAAARRRCSRRSSRTCTTAARRCAWRRSIPTSAPIRRGPGPARTETINCVSNYQFGWHITYPYADEVAPLLPAGTIIHVTSWHDNTAANKYNPNPRNWVGYGQRTIDEMSFAWVSLFYIDEAEYQERDQGSARPMSNARASRVLALRRGERLRSAAARRAAADRAAVDEVLERPGHPAVLRGLDSQPRRHLRSRCSATSIATGRRSSRLPPAPRTRSSPADPIAASRRIFCRGGKAGSTASACRAISASRC